jgi:carboxypeptidase Taq
MRITIVRRFDEGKMILETKLAELKQRLLEISDLRATNALLYWDMATYMPQGGAEARARQLGLLEKLIHERFTDAAIGRLLDDLRTYGEGLPYDSNDAALIRQTKRDYDREVRIPNEFAAAFAEHTSETYNLWVQARPANDFAKVRPALEKTLDMSRQIADFFPGYESIIDPLIDFSDYGMKASSVRAIFAQLRAELVPLVQAITAQAETDDSTLRRHYPEEGQRAFGEAVIRDYGYDFGRGRQDKTAHPFMTTFSLGDIRITTRFKDNYLVDGLFSTLHEAGHALYEQGIDMALDGTPLAGGTSSGVHESQSRLWENIIGRSRPFWEHYYPALQATFPEQLDDVPLDTFHRAINKVVPSLIRTDADEVTYNLHVMLRFGLEVDLLEGRLEVKDLPQTWHERYASDLGITAPDDRDGILQDVHWYSGTIGGAFQGYTLGNILSAQFYEAALAAHPDIPADTARGEFGTLHGWLKTNIYQHGSKYTASELTERVTGGGLNVQPLVRYLRDKYAALYRL